jgi:hypothetical protein
LAAGPIKIGSGAGATGRLNVREGSVYAQAFSDTVPAQSEFVTINADGKTIDYADGLPLRPIIVGQSGSGYLTLFPGAVVTAEDVTIADAAGSLGAADVQAKSWLLAMGTITVGKGGNGTLKIAGADAAGEVGLVISGRGKIGGGVGTVDVGSGGIWNVQDPVAGAFDLGTGGAGTVTVRSGGIIDAVRGGTIQGNRESCAETERCELRMVISTLPRVPAQR